MSELIPVESIVDKIVLLRGEKVILDRDLAELVFERLCLTH